MAGHKGQDGAKVSCSPPPVIRLPCSDPLVDDPDAKGQRCRAASNDDDANDDGSKNSTTTARHTSPQERRRQPQQQEENWSSLYGGNGKRYGRNFNRLISFAHVVQEAKNRGTYVRLYQGDSRFSWYGEWLIDFQNATIFDPIAAARGIPRIIQKNDRLRKERDCSLDMEVKNWYYWIFDNDQQRKDLTNNFFGTEDPSVMIRSLDPSLEFVLPLLQPGFAEEAAKQLHSYRVKHLANLLQRHQNQTEITINDIRTVTVHSQGTTGEVDLRL